jgi:peptidoglycan lytic transglycosylase F
LSRFPRHAFAACLETLLFLIITVSSFLYLFVTYKYENPSIDFFWDKWVTKPSSLDRILEKGDITIITRNSAHCYYLYRDQAMGFEYDLAKAFAEFLGVELNIVIADNWDEMVTRVLANPESLIAASMVSTPSRKNQVAFSNEYLTTRQHIIVHRQNRRIRRAKDLVGKTVHVRYGTAYQESLEALKAQGLNILLALYEDIPTEELIRQVAERTIDVTIADSNIAQLNRRYYPQVMVGRAIAEKNHLGWAVAPQATELLTEINAFFSHIKSNGEFKEIYQRYYSRANDFDFVDIRAYHRRLKSRLPKYQAIIQTAANMHGFDWRLIAAQMYQESHFNPVAESHAGAVGLMQLTKNTAQSLGVVDMKHPGENIHAGVQHLKNLYDYFDKASGIDRLCIALAAYNIGQGHLMDARRLAAKKQLDPNKWSSLSETLPLLRYKKYYRKAIYGYCRGTEPVEYVRQIMLYYDILKHKYLSKPMIALKQ